VSRARAAEPPRRANAAVAANVSANVDPTAFRHPSVAPNDRAWPRERFALEALRAPRRGVTAGAGRLENLLVAFNGWSRCPSPPEHPPAVRLLAGDR
jgi:hypothetical protein